MRRREFEVTDPQETNAVLDAASWGSLALITPQGTPLQVPLNFVRLGDQLYFHGTHDGEKMEVLALNGAASFLVVEPSAILPSPFFGSKTACTAAQLFRSVVVKGRARLVEATAEKAEALQALMAKLQPEGGHAPITADGPGYRASLKGVAVFAMSMETVTGKFKLGQNYGPEVAGRLMEQLERRRGPGDARTLEAMRRSRPSDK